MEGAGVDIVESSRLLSWPYEQEMLDYVFTPTEQAFALARKHPHRCLAALLAAKEALMKALGGEGESDLRWKDIEVVARGERETFRLHGGAGRLCAGKRVHLSIGSCRTYAVSLVMIESGTSPAPSGEEC